MNDFMTALTLLTIFRFPVPNAAISGRALPYYPLVGLLIGIILAGANFLLRIVLPPLVAACLLLVLWVVVTGALHLDGFSDACDALFAATSRERRLEILRDVHLGAFGAVGLMLLLLSKVAALDSTLTFAPLVLAPMLGRWTMVYAAAYPPARREGMAVLFRAGLTRREIFIATLFVALATIPFAWLGVVCWIGALVVSTALARIAVTRLGGLTGDIYGMVCESVELTILLLGVLFFR